MKGLFESVSHMGRKAAVAVEIAKLDQGKAMASPPMRKAMLLTQALVLMMVVAAPAVMAQASGGDLADSANKATDAVRAGKKLAGEILMALAVVAVLGAGLMMKQRSKEGANSQIKVGAILGTLGAGILFMGGGALLYRAGASLGLSQSDYGVIPGN